MNATIWLATPSATIPLELTDCNAANAKTGNIITWETATEQQTDWFVIERQNAKGAFDEIGRVKAAGDSNQKRTYRFEA